jgi:hypothetical protein
MLIPADFAQSLDWRSWRHSGAAKKRLDHRGLANPAFAQDHSFASDMPPTDKLTEQRFCQSETVNVVATRIVTEGSHYAGVCISVFVAINIEMNL